MLALGYDRLAADIKLMIGVHIGWYWKVTWKFISPITLVVSSPHPPPDGTCVLLSLQDLPGGVPAFDSPGICGKCLTKFVEHLVIPFSTY